MASNTKVTWLKRNRRDQKLLEKRQKRLKLTNRKNAYKRVKELNSLVIVNHTPQS